MALAGLNIIGESINDSVPSTNTLYEAGDIDAVVALARSQDERGAAYIDVNVGRRPAAFMAEMVARIQTVTAKPLSIDTPDPELAAAGLKAYDRAKAGGRPPILNSISPLRLQLFDLHVIQPFAAILMASERVEEGRNQPNRTADQTVETARFLLEEARRRIPGFANQHAIIDPGIAPVGSDLEGQLRRVIESMRLIHADPLFAGVHISVGLSNFTVMLPSRRADGSAVKGPLESAFLTMAMPLGLDMIVGSTSRKYERLSPDHPAMRCLEDVLKLDGFDTIARVMEFYS